MHLTYQSAVREVSTDEKALDSSAQTGETQDLSSVKTASNTVQQQGTQGSDTDGSANTADQQVGLAD